jgi:putative oxidoreductase
VLIPWHVACFSGVVADIDGEERLRFGPDRHRSRGIGKETMFTRVGKTSASRDVRVKFAAYAAIPLQLMVGYGFLAHGLAKWHRGPEAFAGILQAIGVPSPPLMAWLTIATEILSGIAILIGAFISLVSIPAIILLAVAILTVHLPYGFSSIKLLNVSNGRAQFGPPGYECDLLYIACVVALALIGPTPWSVDHYRSRVFASSAGPNTRTVMFRDPAP